MEILRQHLHPSLRFLIQNPGFAAAVIATLALGVGSTTAIFCLVDAVLLRPLDFPDSRQLVVLYESNAERNVSKSRVSPPTFLDWRHKSETLSGLAAFARTSYVLGGETVRRVPALEVTPGFFEVLRVVPQKGRLFAPEDGLPGRTPVVLVTHDFWLRHLGGREEVVGTSFELSEKSYTVQGVLPEGLRLYEEADLITPLTFADDELTEGMRGARYLQVIARLRDDVSLGAAQEAMSVLAARLGQDHPNLAGWDVHILRLEEQLVGASRRALLLLLAAVGFVLLVACANVANLFLTRAAGRRREMAVRHALGAGRGRLLAQGLLESTMPALVGGGLGLLLAAWAVDLMGLLPWSIPRLDEVGVDARSAAFALAVAVAAGLLTGLTPALLISRPECSGSLRETGTSAHSGGLRLRAVFIVFETALALVLLVGAGLLLRSFSLVRSVDPGFRATGTVSAMLALPESRYDEAGRRFFWDELLSRLEATPEIESATVATNLPISGSKMTFGFSLPERPRGAAEPERVAEYHAVSPDYFRTMGIPLLRGRDFETRDREDAVPVAVINQALAELYFPGENPLGQRLATHYDGEERVIVGVAASVRHFGLAAETGPEMYVPYAQNPWRFAYLVVRGQGEETEPLPVRVRSAVAAIDPKLPAGQITETEAELSASLAPRRFQALLVGLFGGAALLLTMLGLSSVVAYSFAQRIREVAIRMALGARTSDITWQFLRQGLVLTVAGLALGTAAALALTRYLASLLYGVSAQDPMTFFVTAVLLLTVALLSCLRPARRAGKLEAMAALRGDS